MCVGKFDQNTFREELQLNGGSVLKWRFVLIENDVGDNASGPICNIQVRLQIVCYHDLHSNCEEDQLRKFVSEPLYSSAPNVL